MSGLPVAQTTVVATPEEAVVYDLEPLHLRLCKYDQAVTSRWPRRRSRRPQNDESTRRAQDALTAAFLDMDKRQSIAESAVQASEQLFPERRMRAQWDPVANVCYLASSAYLAVTEQPDPTTRTPNQPTPFAQSSFDRTLQQLAAASHAVDEFYGAHRAHLEGALSTLAAVPAVAQQALGAASAVREQLTGETARFVEYPSVRSRAQALDEAVAALEAARGAGLANAIREAASRVRAAVTALERALADAPEQENHARQGVASVSTRISAVRTRAERLAPAYSSLLREFNAASSADLGTNERTSERFIEKADADLAQAKAALADGNPERSLELTASVRANLAEAEKLVDAVTDRLALLRTIRENPKVKEDEVRFKLRDAQMLALSRGIAKEWSSVLDAQLERIDRVTGQLHGRHPDYWAYVSGLDAVSAFISGVVQRMRNQPPEPRKPGDR